MLSSLTGLSWNTPMCRTHNLPQLTKRKRYEEAMREIIKTKGAWNTEGKYQPEVAALQFKTHQTKLLSVICTALQTLLPVLYMPPILQPIEVLMVSHILPVCAYLSLHMFFFSPGALVLLHPPSNTYLSSSDFPSIFPPLRGLWPLPPPPKETRPITLLT